MMDFVVSLPKSACGNMSIWVIVDRLTNSSHFLPIKITLRLERLAQFYDKYIV